MKSSASGMCIDSMEQPVGRDVELYECHGEGRNQVNCTFLSPTYFLQEKNACYLTDSVEQKFQGVFIISNISSIGLGLQGFKFV